MVTIMQVVEAKSSSWDVIMYMNIICLPLSPVDGQLSISWLAHNGAGTAERTIIYLTALASKQTGCSICLATVSVCPCRVNEYTLMSASDLYWWSNCESIQREPVLPLKKETQIYKIWGYFMIFFKSSCFFLDSPASGYEPSGLKLILNDPDYCFHFDKLQQCHCIHLWLKKL